MEHRLLWDLTGPEIEAESFRRIDAEAAPEQRARFTAAEWHVARRLVHTTADFGILDFLKFTSGAVESGLAALRRGALIYTDSNMIKSGLSVPKLQKFHPGYTRDSILCPVADPATARLAAERSITRALAAVELHAERLDGAIFLCGNAPLALAGMVKLALERGIRPALAVGMPVGFVNVVESKEYLMETDLEYITLAGRRGGSPLAVATLHGIIENA